MRKIRLLALLLCLMSCTLLLSGCHGAKDSTAFVIPDSFDTSREYQLTFWAKNDSNATQQNIYKKAIADFEALYPNVLITLRPYTDYGRIYNDVITNIATGTTPNICITYPDHIATYLTGEHCVVPRCIIRRRGSRWWCRWMRCSRMKNLVLAAAKYALTHRQRTKSSPNSSRKAWSAACSTPCLTCAPRKPAT